VLRLWTPAQGEITPRDMDDVMRFNEAIDQSLAESVTRYTQDLDQSKDMFLAILGHDLRTPLSAIVTSAKFITGTQELEEPHLALMSRIVRSATRMSVMVGDLLDFTRSRLGGGIPIDRAPMSMARAAQDVADEIAAAHPHRVIRVEPRGEQRGEWDCARISQALTNLLANAVEHGSAAMPIRLCVDGEGHGEVTVTVHNCGPAIPAERLEGIFNPMKARDAGGSTGADGPSGSLGLGLYIAERIVAAHNGRIEVESSDDRGTTFTVHLPRHG
jgi:signal transduction histidine kinase